MNRQEHIPGHYAEHYQEALQAEAAGQKARAAQMYQTLLQAFPERPNLAFRLGLLADRQGDLKTAEHWYRHELSRFPDFWACRANLGQLLLQTQRPLEAQHELSQALRDCPLSEATAQAELFLQRARSQRLQGKIAEALTDLKRARADAPSDPELHARLAREQARYHQFWGQQELCRHYYLEALKLHPNPKLQREYAHSLTGFQDYRRAQTEFLHLAQASEQSPPNQRALDLGQAANCAAEDNRPEAALELYDQALQTAALPSLKLARISVLPLLYPTLEAVQNWRQSFTQHLQTLHLNSFEEAEENPLNLISLPFYLPYQGENDRDLLSLYSDQLRAALPPFQSGRLQRKAGPLRVGCLSHFFYRHSVMRCFAPILQALGRDFELHLISASPLLQDNLSQDLQGCARSWTVLRGPLSAQLEQIQSLDLDLLLYTDTLLDPHTYLLSHYRLAPIQALFPGQPTTSGVASLDYFLSDQISEPEQAPSHYRENLVLFPRLPTVYAPSNLSELQHKPLSRATLKLPSSGRLYLCAASLFKLHPEMDPALRAILQGDPEGHLLLLDGPGNGPDLKTPLQARLSQGLDPSESLRLHFLPRLSQARFLHLLRQVDLLLETWPFGSANTLMEALQIGLPVLTLPGAYLRGRYAQTLLRLLDCPELIATNPIDYAERALQVAQDRRLNQRLRHKILAHQAQILMNWDHYTPLRDWIHQICTMP